MKQYGDYVVTEEYMKAENVELMREGMELCIRQIMEEKPGSRLLNAYIIIHAARNGFPATIAWKAEMLEPGEEAPEDKMRKLMPYDE